MIDKILESKILAYTIVIILLAVMMLPIYWTLVTAFKPDMETYVFPPVYFPRNPTFEPFKHLFRDYPFALYIRNSIIVTFVTTFFVTLTGMFAAYGISQYSFKGGTAVLYILLLVSGMPRIEILGWRQHEALNGRFASSMLVQIYGGDDVFEINL